MEELEMKKTLKSNSLSMLIGVLLGAALFGGGTVLASSGVMATPSTQSIYVDGQRVNMTAYSIGGNNSVKLRDVGEAVDFAVSYDAATKSVQIDSDAPYVAESKAPAATTAPTKPATSSAPAGAISVPQTDEAPFVPKEGDVILCDDGSTYTITDMSHYRNHASPGALPTATCDWSISRTSMVMTSLSATFMKPAGCNIHSTMPLVQTAKHGKMENCFFGAMEFPMQEFS